MAAQRSDTAGQAEALPELLLERKLITAKQRERVLKRQEETGGGFVSALIQLGFVTDGVLKTLGEELGIRTVDPTTESPDPAATSLIEGKIARRHHAIPIGFQGDRLVLATSDPENTDALDEVAVLTQLVVEPALATPDAIARVIDEVYGSETQATSEVRKPATEELGDADGDVRRVGRRLGVGEDVLVVDIHELLEEVLVRDASDLHVTAGIPPTIRLHGELTPLDGYPLLEPDDLQKLVYGMLTQKQREKLENDLELDFSYSLPGKARFRVNVYVQRGAFGAAFRLIPFQIKPLEELGMPAKVAEFAYLPRGLIVVTGPTGSGKSTTLASIIDIVNRERPVHIMTIEDPIEFLHTHKRAIVNQREIGADTHGFSHALRHVLRQDPDVILVGEMRDLETIHMAITAAETGHLVFGTLHTQDAPQTVDRIIDVFPPHQQQQIRVQLAGSLQGVVAQQLLQTVDGQGRAAASEILVVTPAVRNLIREAKTHQIYSSIQSGGQFGMHTMDSSLAELVRRRKVTLDAAKERCHSVDELTRLVGSVEGPVGGMKAKVVG